MSINCEIDQGEESAVIPCSNLIWKGIEIIKAPVDEPSKTDL